MRLYRALQSIILGPPVMATVRLSSWTVLSEIAHLYQIQHAAEGMGFTGWIMVSLKGRLEAEFEGPKDDLEPFISSIATGQLTGREIPLERSWGMFQNRYPSLRLRQPDMVVHDREYRSRSGY